MLMDHVNRYTFFNFYLIHNQATESSFLPRYTLYRISSTEYLVHKYIASLNEVK